MAVTKIRKLSSWTFVIMTIISVAVFALFYFGGEDAPVGVDQFKNPTHTGTLLYWMYILFGITTLSLILFAILQFANNFKANPKKALASLGLLVAFVVLMVIAYSIGDATPMPGINVDSQKYNIPFWLKVTDMWLYSMYTLSTLAIIAMIWGAIKKLLNK